MQDAKTDDKPRQYLQITRDESKTKHQQLADASLSSVTRGAHASVAWASKTMGEIGVNEAVSFIEARASEAARGDLESAKKMLMAQAVTLDAMFSDLMQRAAGSIKTTEGGGWSFTKQTMDDLTRIAMKAQSQCRATLQTLGELVHPRSVAYIRADQANLSQGPQQVNNGTAAAQMDRTQGKAPGANELLEGNPSERMDTRAKGAAGGANPILAPVGAIHGTEVGGGKVRSLPKRAKAR